MVYCKDTRRKGFIKGTVSYFGKDTRVRLEISLQFSRLKSKYEMEPGAEDTLKSDPDHQRQNLFVSASQSDHILAMGLVLFLLF